jgi:hypothetical protein
MSTALWIIIIAAILLLWFIWTKYGSLINFVTGNPTAVHAAESASRYLTDITGLIGAYDTASNTQGNFMSRLGAFIGVLPT